MNLELVKDIVIVVNPLLTLGIGVWLYLEKRSDKTNERVSQTQAQLAELREDVDDRLGAQGRKLAHVEATVAALPTHRDLGEMHEKMNETSKALSGLAGEFHAVRRLVEDLNNYLRGKL